jgi:hypothetical protein
MEGLPNFQPTPLDSAVMSRITDISVTQKLTPKQMGAILRKEGWGKPNKHIRRLMRFMGLETRPQQ